MRKTVSIIIPVWNELELTKGCVDSINKYYPHDHDEIILVNNGSTDGTKEWLDDLGSKYPWYKIIHNESNLGPGKATNQGIEVAMGEYLVFLNNDTLVTEGWLDRMITCAESDPNIGIVGVMSNCVSGPQLVPGINSYDHAGGLEEFAQRFGEVNKGKITPFWRTIGPCYMIKRSTIVEVGVFDEQFFPGNFEDDDLCVRVEMVGYRNVICGDVFIHHYGSVGYRKMDFDSILAANREKFNKKWMKNREAREIMGIPMPTLGVALIVKDEEGCIERCLKSVEEADEIVVVDTGSTDHTCDIVRQYTDKCYQGEYVWNDDFAEARNIALGHCTTDWILSIDADEVLDEGGVDRIREIIETPGITEDAIQVLMHHGDDQFYNTKVFRKGLQYMGRIHEYILSTGVVENSGVGIEFNVSESHAKDPDRNIRILEGEARRDPFNPRTQYCMLREYFILGYFPNAVYWGERYRVDVERLRILDAEYADAMFTLALCYEKMMDYEKAISTCMECIVINADFKEACEMMARLSEKTGNMLNRDRWTEFSTTAQNRGLNFKTKGQF